MNFKVAFIVGRILTTESYDRMIKLLDCLEEIQKSKQDHSFTINSYGFSNSEEALKDIAKRKNIQYNIKRVEKEKKRSWTRSYAHIVRSVHPKHKRMGKLAFLHLCHITSLVKGNDLIIGVPNNGKGRGAFGLRAASWYFKPSIDLTSCTADTDIDKLYSKMQKLKNYRENKEERLAAAAKKKLDRYKSSGIFERVFNQAVAAQVQPDPPEWPVDELINPPGIPLHPDNYIAAEAPMPNPYIQNYDGVALGGFDAQIDMVRIAFGPPTPGNPQGILASTVSRPTRYLKRNVEGQEMETRLIDLCVNRLDELVVTGGVSRPGYNRMIDLLMDGKFFWSM